ncbi:MULTISPECIES: Bug family tripartite tricarboxylate transporter substrate binding protein [Alcaligenes]|jgi:tripartite-type tricarboxylate transporter receptor subunit TctC|uniref:Tripartite tricarboxylate transporter substrate binding protein n=1 Tax=Alcaligenes faecalis TaxID=511 RepID=A0A2U2BJL1_ALCFA|nr:MULTISPECIES: tripartite tricarboxylate transporter substrate binding protein [Alcaligenes]ATI01285.1 tripartite tricarboxylate transporter substrate binding protein [Alcaligenes faecalis]AYZ90642.1 tripartite tricarboxylate transporter substrate binding protein [Alcaligenes faecalis]MBQ0216925.1 tripartite tricarboxylate transporter substrate binding protein [Alcaligenes faecalis]MBY6310480.1 tripartite tricarboxylate transporter substrate binding protein [Alcaligenes faecalis]MBY6318005.1
MRFKLILSGVAALSALTAVPSLAAAQDYPTKPITIIVPFPAGGTLDNLTRSLAQKMSDDFKQPVIIDNKPGAGTVIGTEIVARAAPDGYTLGMVANSFAINPSLYDNLRYDTVKDFTPVSWVAYTPHLLVANPDVPVKSLADVIATAKSKPGELSFASFGAGTSPHIAIERLKSEAKIDVLHIPYKGQAPALNDLLGGHVDMMFANTPDVLPHVKSGKLRAIALANDARLESIPDVPTFKEAGVDNMNSNSWYGVIVPSGTPAPIVEKLSAEFVRIVNLPEIRERLLAQGLEPAGTTSAEFAEYLKSEMEMAATVVKASGASVQ